MKRAAKLVFNVAREAGHRARIRRERAVLELKNLFKAIAIEKAITEKKQQEQETRKKRAEMLKNKKVTN